MSIQLNLVRNLALSDTATNDDTSTVGEPSIAMAGQSLFMTGNWYAARSSDSGATWAHVDPFTTLPAPPGNPFCCDQVVVHDPRRDVSIWILQYVQQNGENFFRLAATRDDAFGSASWYWWDIRPTTLDASWTGVWFDYPDAALTNDNLFVTFNVFNAAGQWQRAVAMRMPLDTIRDAGTLVFNFWSTTNNGSLRLSQGAGSTMYWASPNSQQQVRLFSWPDGGGQISWWDVNVRQWQAAISSIAPNGVDWLGRADDRITGVTVGAGTITLMWTAGSDGNHAHAYCRVVRIRESNKQLLDEPDIWSANRAWAYPAVSADGSGRLGFTAFYGGVDRPPGHVVGLRDDASSAWVTVYTHLGSDSPTQPKWGDYLTCRADASGTGWIATGYTLDGGDTRNDIVPRVARFAVAASGWADGWAELYSDSDNLRMLDVGRNADGRLEVFGVNSAGNIWHTWQVTPNGGWAGGWAELYNDNDNLASLRVASNADGRLEVFGVNSAGNIWHTWQVTPNGGWANGWAELYNDNDNLRMLDVGRNADGRLEVFGVNSAGNIWHTWQVTPNGGWAGGWAELYNDNDNLTSLRVAPNADGRLEVFGVNSAGNIWHTWQVTPNGGWAGGWAELYSDSDNLRMLDVGRNADGRLEVFGVNSAGNIWHTWQVTPNGGWAGGWAELYNDNDNLASLRVASNADGRLEVFGVNSAGNIWHTWQVTPNGGWANGWAELYNDNDNLRMLDVAANADGRLEVFGVNSADHIWHTWQT